MHARDTGAKAARGRGMVKTKGFRAFRPRVDAGELETRALLAVTYTQLGPFAMTPANNSTTFQPYVGAVQAVVAKPGDASTIYLGTVNGGVWKTTDGGQTWAALTDKQASLSIGALSLDPTDTTSNTLVAGIGLYSSKAGQGGSQTGLLRTTDGGETWTPLAQSDLAGKSIRGVAGRGNILLAATDGGLYRSTDGGAAFSQVRIDRNQAPSVAVDDLVGDPGNTNRLFAASRKGVYMTTDAGATWTNITGSAGGMLASLFNNTLTRAKMAVYDTAAGSNPVVYVGVLNSNMVSNVFRSANLSGTWTALGLPFTKSAQGSLHFAIAADPSDPQTVYIGKSSNGLYRYNPGPSPSWTRLDEAPFPGPYPNSDPRDVTIDAAGNLVEANDGGVNRLPRPRTNSGAWSNINGTGPNGLADAETFSVAFDPLTKTVIAGSQDNGDPATRANGTWFDAGPALADGGYVQIDPTTGMRYTSEQYLGMLNRRKLDDATATPVKLMVVNPDGSPTNQALAAYAAANKDNIPFYAPIHLNAVNPSRLVIGTRNVYESSNQGDTITPLLSTPGSVVTALAYGGKNADGTNNPDVLYVGTQTGLLLRTAAKGALAATNFPGTGVRAIAIDPNNWQVAFVVDQNNRVFVTTNAGVPQPTWNDVTGGLSDPFLQAVAFIPNPTAASGSGNYAVLVGGQAGIHRMNSLAAGSWAPITGNLPNAPVTDLQYSSANDDNGVPNDTLIVATLGRGDWRVTPFRTVNGQPNPDLFAAPPTISAVPAQAVAVGAGAVTVDFTVGSSAGSDPATLTVAATSSDQSLLLSSGLVLGGSGAPRTLTITPASGRAGRATVQLLLTDPATGAQAVTSFAFLAANLGTGPAIFPIADVSVPQGTASIVIPVRFQMIDPSAIRSYSLSSTNPNLTSTSYTLSPRAGTLTIEPPNGASGSGTATLSVTVNGESYRSNSFRVTVTPNPAPPVLLPIANQVSAGSGKAAVPIELVIPTQPPGYQYIADRKASDTVADAVEVETEVGNAQVFIDSSNPGLLAPNNVQVTQNARGGFEVDYATTPGVTGTSRVTLTVADGEFQASQSFNVTVTPEAGLSVTARPVASGVVRHALTYTLTVINAGPDLAAGVTLTDTLPAGVRFVSASAGTISKGVLTAHLGNLAPGEKLVFTVTVFPTAAGTFTNRATITSGTADLSTANKTVSVITTVTRPTLSLTGGLAAGSDTGSSATDNVTNVSAPVFTGTTAPGATVRLYVQQSGGPLVAAGQTTAGAGGTWRAALSPLADGVYYVEAKADDGLGDTAKSFLTPVGRPLVVATAGPRLVAAALRPGLGGVQLTFQGGLAGLDLTSLLNPANYALTGPFRFPRRTHAVTSVQLVATTALGTSVLVSFDNNRRLATGRYVVSVSPGGVRDLAGNPLSAGAGTPVALSPPLTVFFIDTGRNVFGGRYATLGSTRIPLASAPTLRATGRRHAAASSR